MHDVYGVYYDWGAHFAHYKISYKELETCMFGRSIKDFLLDKNKIDFVLWLCEGGPHGDEFDFYDNDVEWRASMIDKAQVGVKMNGMGELNVKVLSKFSKEYPIIYNKK